MVRQGVFGVLRSGLRHGKFFHLNTWQKFVCQRKESLGNEEDFEVSFSLGNNRSGWFAGVAFSKFCVCKRWGWGWLG